MLRAKLSAFNIGTGAAGTLVNVIDVGFDPAFVLFFWGGRTEAIDAQNEQDIQAGFGIAITPSSQANVALQSDHGAATQQCDNVNRSDSCISSLTIAGAVDGTAVYNAKRGDGFQLQITNNFARNLRVHYLAVGGSDIERLHLGTLAVPTAQGTQDITDPGFQPDSAIFLTGDGFAALNTPDTWIMFGAGAAAGANQASLLTRCQGDGGAASVTHSYAASGECYSITFDVAWLRAALQSWLTNGFRLNWTSTHGAVSHDVIYLAIKGARFEVANFTTRTDTTPFSVPVSFRPKAGLFFSACEPQHGLATVTNHARLSIGAVDENLGQGVHGLFDRHASANMDCATVVEHDAVYAKLSTANPSVRDALMRCTAITDNGFDMVMDDADSAASFVFCLAIGALPAVKRYAISKAETMTHPARAGRTVRAPTLCKYCFNSGSAPLGPAEFHIDDASTWCLCRLDDDFDAFRCSSDPDVFVLPPVALGDSIDARGRAILQAAKTRLGFASDVNAPTTWREALNDIGQELGSGFDVDLWGAAS